MKSKTRKSEKQKKKIVIDPAWELINPNAAGIDIGSREHWACVPARSAEKMSVRLALLPPTLKPWPPGFRNAESKPWPWKRRGFIGFPFSKSWNGGDSR
jgi:hypothetical protein